VRVGIIFITLAAAWGLQILLAWRQAQSFMTRVRTLRRSGRVAIGSSGSRMRGRAYVALAIAPDGRVTAAETLRGMTVFARPRPVPALIGRSSSALADGEDMPAVHVRVREGTRSAAAILHRRPGSAQAAPAPWWRRLRLPLRGGAARA
jgi:glucitol operon activator protein